MTAVSFSAVFLASLLGSAHCVGMCGGLALFCAGAAPTRIAPQLSYHFGRLCSYASIGALAGLIGNSINTVGSLAGLQEAAALVSGVLLVVWGISALGWGSSFTSSSKLSRKFTELIAKLFRSSFKRNGNNDSGQEIRHIWIFRTFLVGLLTVFLPCGWLYAFVLVAAGTASPLLGSICMFAFWAGSVPALLAFGSVATLLTEPMKRFVPRLTAVLLIIAGLCSVFGREHLGGMLSLHQGHSHHATSSHHH